MITKLSKQELLNLPRKEDKKGNYTNQKEVSDFFSCFNFPFMQNLDKLI